MVEGRLYTPERGLWKGPDIVTAQSAVIHRYERVPVVITKESIPFGLSLFKHNVPSQWFMSDIRSQGRYIHPSVRSRYAQLGLNIDDGLLDQVGRWLQSNSHLDEKGELPNEITPFITVENWASCPIALDKGTHLFRFFRDDEKSYLNADELVEAVKLGLIKIQGERLGDWTYSYGYIAGHISPRPTGIFIRINPENRKWIPPSLTNEPMRIPDAGEDYRRVVDSRLQPISKEQTGKILWIGETIKVTLDSSMDAVLDTAAIRGIGADKDILDESTWGIQLNSRVIDGGKTDWQIRTEIISFTSPDKIPNYVHLIFIKKSK